MNDPHVEALVYRVEHEDAWDYSDAGPLHVQYDGFDVELNAGVARITMKRHCATSAEARGAVEGFIQDWVFHANLKGGAGSFDLAFVDAEIVDRSPSSRSLTVSSSLGTLKASVRLVAAPRSYPSPPEDPIDSRAPDAETLYGRYRGFKAGREPLPSFANFCLTVLEASVDGSGRRRRAAARYRISPAVLGRIGALCDGKGGDGARKAKGLGKPFSDEEQRFLERAVEAVIYRVAAHHGASDPSALAQITLSGIVGAGEEGSIRPE